MTASQSYLSNARYGYDFVVATTQGSINATLKEYLSGLNAPVVTQCYIYDAQGQPQSITLDQVLQQTKNAQFPNGVNPFSIPNGTAVSDPRIQALSTLGFAYGFQAQIGLPGGYAPASIPDVVSLNPGAPGSVTFNLMCSQFNLSELSYGPRGPMSWLNGSQPNGNAWLFTSQVNLQSLTVGSADFQKLPPAVQQQINNLGAGAFSVQQLLFDLDTAALESVPTISGVAPGTPLYTCLQTVFLGAYFSQMQASGQPVLGYTVSMNQIPQGSLTPTSISFEANAFVDSTGNPVSSPNPQQQQAQPLCYLCEVNGNTQLPATQFNWNWIDLSQTSQFDGVMAINRNTFANFLAAQIAPLLPINCFNPSVTVSMDGLDVDYRWSLTPYQQPTPTLQPSGSEVYCFSWQSGTASDQAGLGGDMGKMELSSSLNVTVTFQNNQIIIAQHLVIYAYIRVMQTSASGNIVDKTITDTYTLSVDQNGQLMASRASATTDHSETPSVNGFLDFFTGLNDLVKDVANWSRNFVATNLQDLPINVVQSFVFPGGSTFTFKDVQFSGNQDLVSHITYVQPGQQAMAMRSRIRVEAADAIEV